MNELLQQHGCSNVFTVPEGLKELMSDITREVLRDQPHKIFDYIANYLSVLLITREHGVLAVKILEDLCDCRPSLEEHLRHIGISNSQATMLAQVIKQEIEGFEPTEGKEKFREIQIMKKVLSLNLLDEEMTGKICQIVRNSYRDYWYRKKLMEQSLCTEPHETWELAAEHTLEIYKRTKPSFSELSLATIKIQAAYRGFYVRKNLLRHLKKPKVKKPAPKVDLPGPPMDIASSREIDLGPKIEIKVREDDVGTMFEEDANEKLGLRYDTMKTITHVEEKTVGEQTESIGSKIALGRNRSLKSAKGRNESVTFETVSQSGSNYRDQGTKSFSESNDMRHSRVSSQTTENTSVNKINFSNVPKVIHITEEAQEGPGLRGQEYDEWADEDTAEVPEEIIEGVTQDEIHVASAPSSAPDTDIEFTTDVDTEVEDGV